MTYFVRTLPGTGASLSLFALKGQLFPDGTAVRTDIAIPGALSIRKKYPVGTVFGMDRLICQSERYLGSSKMYPVSTAATSINEAAPVQMRSDWDKYVRTYGEPEPVESILQVGLFDGGGEGIESGQDTAKAPVIPGALPGETVLEAVTRLYPCPTIEKDSFFVDPDIWAILTRNVVRSANTLIYGCQGLGKTELVQMLAKKMGKKLHIFDMGSMHDPHAQLLGTHRLVSEKGSTVSVFDRADFSYAIEEDGIILLDEINRASTVTLNMLMPLLDNRRTLRMEEAKGSDVREIHVHPDCCFFATANIGERHVGTIPIDPSLKSRFMMQELEHMREDVEADLLVKKHHIKRAAAMNIVGIANETRKAVEEGTLDVEITPRDTLRCAFAIADGFPILKAMQLIFLPIYERMGTGQRDIVRAMFMTR